MIDRPSVARVIPFLLLLSGCAGIQVTTDYDPAVDLTTLRNYAWMKGQQARQSDPRIDNSLLDTRIRNAIDAELAGKGFEVMGADQADFLVGYHAAVQKKIDAYTMSNSYGYRPGWGTGYSDIHVYEYEEGSLVIDFVDPKTKNLLWRGAAQAEVNRSLTPEKRETRIRTAVEKILARFPPK
jgi:hypothetical protein